jgi:hypothetical protein
MGASFCFVKACSCTMTLLDNSGWIIKYESDIPRLTTCYPFIDMGGIGL